MQCIMTCLRSQFFGSLILIFETSKYDYLKIIVYKQIETYSLRNEG